jgi:hypothetical protein
MIHALNVGPKAIALAPAIVRSAMTLKTLLPESSAPGWAAVLSAPLMILLVTIVMSAIVQLEGSPWLLLGTLCLVGSPLVDIVRAREIVTPRPEAPAERLVRRVRGASAVFTSLAVGLIGLFFLRSVTLGLADGFRFGVSVLGNVLTFKVVAADLLLPLLWTAHEHGLRFHDSPEQQALDRRFHVLVAADLA